MTDTSRRQFLQQAGAAAVLAATAPRLRAEAAAPQTDAASAARKTIPPHRAVELPGVHAYADMQSVCAGEVIRFHISSSEPSETRIYRLGTVVEDPASDVLMHAFAPERGEVQPIHPGSYIHVEKGIQTAPQALSIECWIRLWQVSGTQGIFTQKTGLEGREACGFGLWIGGGSLQFLLGDGQSKAASLLHQTEKGVLTKNQWHHVVATWDGTSKEIWVDAQRVGKWDFSGPLLVEDAPIRIGAGAALGAAEGFLDADIALPALYGRALEAAEIQARFAARGAAPTPGADLLAFWPLNEENGEHVAEGSGKERHGRIINSATWMIGGPAYEAEKVPRYGEYAPERDPARGHALRLASDDLFDCRWKPTHAWKVPLDAKPGIYVAKIQFTRQGQTEEYPLTFLVRRADTQPKAPILVLCSTSTWLAYNAACFSGNIPPDTFVGTGGYKNSHGLAPAFSCYRNHRGGQPAYQFGLRMPWPVAGPQVLYSPKESGYSHLMRTERFFHAWLEQSGFAYDVIADLDLHRDPAQLEGYRTVVLNGHSEYWSREAYEGLDRYLSRGGTAIVLSGNTMFWRTSFNEDGSIMECRKLDERIGGRENTRIGELFHTHDKKRGSLMRECGLPAWKVIGLECIGWGGSDSRSFGVYAPETPGHFLFQSPEKIEFAASETFGHGPDRQSHRAVGHEWDTRLSRILKLTTAIPEGATLPEEPAGIECLAVGRGGGGLLDYFGQRGKKGDGVVAEMIYWERPQGGRVFHAGAIGAGWAVSVDPKFQKLMRNVLHHFGVPARTA